MFKYRPITKVFSAADLPELPDNDGDGDDDDSEFVEVDPTGCYGWVSVGMTFLSSSCCYCLLLSFLIFFVFPSLSQESLSF